MACNKFASIPSHTCKHKLEHIVGPKEWKLFPSFTSKEHLLKQSKLLEQSEIEKNCWYDTKQQLTTNVSLICMTPIQGIMYKEKYTISERKHLML